MNEGHALAAFTEAVGGRLPGTWEPSLVDVSTGRLRSTVYDQLWDLGITQWALLSVAYDRLGLLRAPGGGALLVVPRPRRPGRYLVAPLTPHGVDASAVEDLTTCGIAVPAAPARAAAAVTRRLLPSYQQALRAVGREADGSTPAAVPAGRVLAATGRRHRSTTVLASPPAPTISAPLAAGARRART